MRDCFNMISISIINEPKEEQKNREKNPYESNHYKCQTEGTAIKLIHKICDTRHTAMENTKT